MIYRQLGTAGINVSRLCLGTAFRGQKDDNACIKIIDRAIDLGCNFIDCANFYGQGRSEQILGKAIRNKRDDLILTSKVASNMGTGPNDRGLSAFHIHREVDRSLKRLQTDRIDLYLLHKDDQATPLEETLRAMDQLVRMGKVRYIGCCNHSGARIVEGLWISDTKHLFPYTCIQHPYNLLERFEMENSLMPLSQRFGLGVMTYSPLAVGLLSGRYRKGEALPPDNPWSARPERYETYLTDQNIAVINAVVEIAAAHGVTPSQVSIAWLLRRENVTAILGPDTDEQLDDAFGALSLELPEEDLQRLDSVSKPPDILHIA